MTRKGEHSPWGVIQYATTIAPGITSVGTAGHGGIHLDHAHYTKMPDYMKSTGYSRGGWYEEDCDWCLPFVVFEAEILAGGNESSINAITNGHHLSTLANYHPERHAKWISQTGESVTSA